MAADGADGNPPRGKWSRTRRRRGRFARLLAGTAAGTGIVLAALAVWVALPLPDPELPAASRVYDAQGRLITYIAARQRVPVALDEVSPHLRQAVLAGEDPRFYRHFGVDPIAVARAALRNLQAGRIVEGASTITAQVAREYYLTQERTFARKAMEALLTLKLEARMDKDQILEAYLNTVYMGHGAYGAEVAARTYFGKTAAELDLAESALLAAILPSPENFSPYRSPQRARERRDRLLDRMAELNLITGGEAADARARPLTTVGLSETYGDAAHFMDYVRQLLRAALPEVEARLDRGGFRIFTTLDLELQHMAQDAFNKGLGAPARRDAGGVTQPQGALVSIDPRNGYIRAMVGGRDYGESQFNRAVQARRQPGSAFKVFLYTALLDAGVPITATQTCEPVEFPGGAEELYQPRDFGDEPYHYAHLTLRDAVRISDNVAAVKWARELGPATLAAYARRMGIGEDTPLDLNLPLALGASEVTPLELAAAYVPLANLGHRAEPLALLRVEGPDGRVLLRRRPRLEPVLDPVIAYLMTDLLKSVLDDPGGTAHHLRARFQRPAAAKTGTTNERRSAWLVGYTPELVTAVYVGHDDQQPLWGGGGALAGPIWAEFMDRALAPLPVQDWVAPSGVFTARTCILGGSIIAPEVVPVTELFRQGTYPGNLCDALYGFLEMEEVPPEMDHETETEDEGKAEGETEAPRRHLP